MELPADVGPGSTWTGAGSAGDTLDYTSSFRAAPGRDGCLEVSGELDLRTKGRQQQGRRTSLTRTWCPGRGLVATSESAGGDLHRRHPVPAPGPGARDDGRRAVSLDRPARLDAADLGHGDRRRHGRDQGDVRARPRPRVTPVLTASGLVVRALQPPDDLVATTPKTIDAWTPAWSVHPGGTVLSLAAFGSVVLVTTSERELVAYSDAGMRLWAATLPEIGPNAPVRVSDDDAVLVDLSGRVLRFGIADGAVRWSRASRRRQPRAGGRRGARRRGRPAAGRSPRSTRRPAATRWDRSFDASAVAVVGDRVLVDRGPDLTGSTRRPGTTRFLTHFDGAAHRAHGVRRPAGGRLQGGDAAARRRRTGHRTAAGLPRGRPDRDPPRRLDLGPARRRSSADGRVAATWPTRSTSLVSSDRPGLATPQGVYLFGYTKGWTFDSWTTGG